MRRLFVVALVISTAILTACQTATSQVAINVTPTQMIKVEVVHSQAAVTMGLAGRSALADDQGMLFIFDQADRYSFWMKDMKFSLDIIWLNKGKIVSIWPKAPSPNPSQAPTQYQPGQPADMVLEVPAGQVQSWGLKLGQQLNLPPTLDLWRVAR